MFAFGVTIIFPSTICYLSIIPMVKDSLKEKIFQHLEGNTVLFESIEKVTEVRGLLKLDTLINLEFFTCLVYTLLEAQLFIGEHKDVNDLMFILPWAVVALLMILVIFANYHGATTAVSNLFVFFFTHFSKYRLYP